MTSLLHLFRLLLLLPLLLRLVLLLLLLLLLLLYCHLVLPPHPTLLHLHYARRIHPTSSSTTHHSPNSVCRAS